MKLRTNSTNHQRYDYEVTPLSRYSDIIWDLTPLLHDKRSSVYSLGRLNFNLLASKRLLIDPFKHFLYLRLAHVKAVTLANEYASLSGKIIAFMEEENLSSLAQFNTALFMRFNQWLKHHYMSDTKQANNMCRISNTLYKILNMGTNNGFSDLPQQPIQLETSLWDWWGANKQGALERQNGPDDHSIPSYLRAFLKRNNLALMFFNESNQEVSLTSHCFRHTFAKLAASECDVNLVVLQTHFKHLSIEMTSHYVHRSKEDLKQSYLQGMLNAKYLHTQGIEGESFKHRLHSIQTSPNLSDKLDELSKVFGINPLPFGMCLYDFKRGHCPNLGVQSCYTIGCKDFVTNETFLPNFIHEATLLERHIEHCNGTQPIEVKKARFRLSKVTSIIESIQPKDNHA